MYIYISFYVYILVKFQKLGYQSVVALKDTIVQLDDVGLQCKMEIICYWYALNLLDWKSQFIGIHELPSHHIFCIIELSFNHLCTYFFFLPFYVGMQGFFFYSEKSWTCAIYSFKYFFVNIVYMQNTSSMLDLGIIWGWVTL